MVVIINRIIVIGLLDSVVGKVDELSQREILQRRGTELNDVIVERA